LDDGEVNVFGDEAFEAFMMRARRRAGADKTNFCFFLQAAYCNPELAPELAL